MIDTDLNSGAGGDRLGDAALELHRRLGTAHRRQTKLTVALAVIAGLATTIALFVMIVVLGWNPGMGSFAWFSAAMIVAPGVAAAFGVFWSTNLLTRTLQHRARQQWITALARQYGVDAAALAEMALPFGDLPVPSTTDAPRSQLGWSAVVAGFALLGVAAALLAFGLRQQLMIVLCTFLVVSVASIGIWYLGWRSPR